MSYGPLRILISPEATAVLRFIELTADLIMADGQIPEKIDLRDIASQNERLFRELRGILVRLDLAALSDEQLQAKLNELLQIAKGANH
jgi:hypothetical protein